MFETLNGHEFGCWHDDDGREGYAETPGAWKVWDSDTESKWLKNKGNEYLFYFQVVGERVKWWIEYYSRDIPGFNGEIDLPVDCEGQSRVRYTIYIILREIETITGEKIEGLKDPRPVPKYKEVKVISGKELNIPDTHRAFEIVLSATLQGEPVELKGKYIETTEWSTIHQNVYLDNSDAEFAYGEAVKISQWIDQKFGHKGVWD